MQYFAYACFVQSPATAMTRPNIIPVILEPHARTRPRSTHAAAHSGVWEGAVSLAVQVQEVAQLVEAQASLRARAK